jgi:hypothetical protein
MRFIFILFLGMVMFPKMGFGKCIYGNCKDGYGRLQVENKLYCGNFTGKKLNGAVLIAQVATSEFSVAYRTSYSTGKNAVPQWLAVCVVNFKDGKPERFGQHLFYWPIVEDKFSSDLRDYIEYYEGPLTEDGAPENGFAKVYTEYIRFERNGKRLVADSILFQDGIAKSAKFYQSIMVNEGVNVENTVFSPNANCGNNQKVPLFFQVVAGNSIKYYEGKKVKRSEAKMSYVLAPGVNSFTDFKEGGKLFTPDGTFAYEGELSADGNWPKNMNTIKTRCISGDCQNGKGKLLRVMAIRTTNRWLDDGFQQSLTPCICVFEGKFEKGLPVGIFKMWNNYGYDFTGKLNSDFSLNEGTFIDINARIPVKYQGSFGPESEAIGGIFEGGYFLKEGERIRITKDRKWVKD